MTATSPQHDQPLLRVMSYNILTAGAISLLGRWTTRRHAVLAAVRRFGPDLLGTQEASPLQVAHLREELPEHRLFGAGRLDGRGAGEHVAMLYRRDRFEQLDGGHFWLSRRPAQPGSRHWISIVPRMASWLKLRAIPGGQTFCWFNTHFDPFSRTARLFSAGVLRQHIRQLAGELPVIVTGDFNAPADGPMHKTLLGEGDGELRFRDSHPAAGRPEGTDDATIRTPLGLFGRRRIDWILHTRHFAAHDAGIDRTTHDGRHGSDHYPVTAVLGMTPTDA